MKVERCVAGMLLMFCVLMITGSRVNGATMTYGTPGELKFNNGDWENIINAREADLAKVQIAKGDYVQFYFNATLGAWNDRYDHGAAIRWSAPEGEVITGLTFTVAQANGTSYYRTVVSIPDSTGDTNILDNSILWEKTGIIASTAPVTETLTFDPAANVTAIELGFRGKETYAGFISKFDDVAITTTAIPEPVSLLVLALGITGLRFRK